MNTMINPELPQASREELLARIEVGLRRIEELEEKLNAVEGKLNARNITLTMADEHLKSYKKEIEQLHTLAMEHIDDKELFFDAVVKAFDIELTKTVTVDFTVNLRVRATVPASMTAEDVEEELQSAKLDYEFLGNGDIEIKDFDFGDLEVN